MKDLKNRKRMQVKLTILVGIVLLISNVIFLFLLNYSTQIAFEDIVVPIDGMTIEIYSIDNFSQKVQMYGILIAVFMTAFGTFLTYFVLGKFLAPLKELTYRMQKVDKENLTNLLEIKANTSEVESLIDSINDMLSKLKGSFDTQKDFSAYIVHELKTPLSVMRSKIAVFKKKKHNKEEYDELVQTLDEQVEKVDNLISRINDLAQVQRIELKEVIPMDMILEEIFDDLEDMAMKKGVRIDYNAPDFEMESDELRTKTSIVGNHALIYQAFFNIVENAIKYNTQGGEVKISLVEDDNNISIKVADTGLGIKESDYDDVFKPFFRSSNNPKDIEGIGMGLAFSKKVFDHHKAKVSVSKNGEKGTVFKVVLRK